MIENLIKSLVEFHSKSFKPDVSEAIKLALDCTGQDHITLESDDCIEQACIDLVNSLVSYRYLLKLKEEFPTDSMIDPPKLISDSIVAFHSFIHLFA